MMVEVIFTKCDKLIVRKSIFKGEVNQLNTIGQTIKNAREMLHMSQEELAQKVRVGIQTIEKYESGEQIPSTQTLLKLSTVLELPAIELLKK
jgi:ribosome-binding protein aMBF1 (putative translation factor)